MSRELAARAEAIRAKLRHMPDGRINIVCRLHAICTLLADVAEAVESPFERAVSRNTCNKCGKDIGASLWGICSMECLSLLVPPEVQLPIDPAKLATEIAHVIYGSDDAQDTAVGVFSNGPVIRRIEAVIRKHLDAKE